jgi:molybdopterin-binding protein
MNRIPATITAIKAHDGITVISFTAAEQPMRMMALEIDDSLKRGSEVILGVKASNIALAKNPVGLMSISNRLDVTIEHINNGALLSSVKFRLGDTLIESVITLDSSHRMNLQQGDTVVALIKSSELSILEKL